MLLKLTNVDFNDLQSYESDIILNKKLTNVSTSNMYEILFNCDNFDKIFNIVLDAIKKETNDNLDVYVKNMWGYLQDDINFSKIQFDKNFKSQVSVPSKYSFIFGIKSFNTNFYLKSADGVVEKIIVNDGDILIFDTHTFTNDESDNQNRIFLIGSILPVKEDIHIIKKGII
jgi:hypothetical protein